MAAVQQRKLVHKQFNSPIGLYSDNNVKATLDRDLKMMSNGTMGVNYDPSEKPDHLANSAVLKMLQEEENAKRNGPRPGGLRRVAWPPEEYHSPSRVVPHPEGQLADQYESAPPQPQYQQQYRDSRSREPQPVPQQQTQRQPSQQRNFPSADPSFLRGSTPSYLPAAQPDVAATSPYTAAFSGGRAVQPNAARSPYAGSVQSPFPDEIATYQVQPQQSLHIAGIDTVDQQQLHGWSPVKPAAPVHSGSYVLSPPVQQQQHAPQFQQPHQQYQQQPYEQPQYQQQPYADEQQLHYNQQPVHRFPSAEPQYQTEPQQFYPPTVDQQYHYRQPSPGMVTLRKEAPIMQESSPVFNSQPAAAKFGGGNNMRGDQKWPPQEYKQSEVENAERRRLAQGPVFRPRRVQKDYTGFFNQHALNSTYPSYRAPPGTQHSIEQ